MLEEKPDTEVTICHIAASYALKAVLRQIIDHPTFKAEASPNIKELITNIFQDFVDDLEQGR